MELPGGDNPAVTSSRRPARGIAFRGIGVLPFIAPFVCVLVLFQYIPIAELFYESVHSFSFTGGKDRYVGTKNYQQLVHDPIAIHSFVVTILFAVGLVVAEVVFGLALALMVQRSTLPRRMLRALVFWPVVTSAVVVTTIWTFLYDPSHGLINSTINSLGFESLPFLTSTTEALPAVIVMTVWEQVGISMLLYLGGLQAIPRDVLEAAAIDGARTVQRLWYVVLPLLRRSTAVVVVVGTVFAFQAFAPPFIMTQGGPENSTNFIVYEIYQEAFTFFQPGYAAALSVVLLAIVLVVSTVQLRALRAKH